MGGKLTISDQIIGVVSRGGLPGAGGSGAQININFSICHGDALSRHWQDLHYTTVVVLLMETNNLCLMSYVHLNTRC